MDRYDRDWNRGMGRDYGRASGWGYASDFGSWGDAWGTVPWSSMRGRGVGLYRQWGTPGEAFAYDRGMYGSDYGEFGGYPGARNRGMYFWGRGGYATDYDRFGGRMNRQSPYGGYGRSSGYGRGGYGRTGYDQGYGRGGYDQGYTGGTFVPEEAYRRHPEMNHPQRALPDRWPAYNNDEQWDRDFGDDEILQSVRQNLHQDDYIHPDRIQVEVNDNVVTLKGEVDDYLEARYAWDDAWEARGVRGVVNQLSVRLDKPLDEHEEPFPQTAGEHQGASAGGGRTKRGG